MTYALVKLLSGDDIIAQIEEYETYIIVHDPVQIVRHMTKWGPTIGVIDWLTFAEEKVSTIERSKIVAISLNLQDNAVRQYLQYVQQDNHPPEYEQEDVERLSDDLLEELESIANTTIH